MCRSLFVVSCFIINFAQTPARAEAATQRLMSSDSAQQYGPFFMEPNIRFPFSDPLDPAILEMQAHAAGNNSSICHLGSPKIISSVLSNLTTNIAFLFSVTNLH